MAKQTHELQMRQGETDFFAGRPRVKNAGYFYNQGYNRGRELAFLGACFHYAMLPGGNRGEFTGIDNELKRLNITFEYAEDVSRAERSGRMYRIAHTEGSKLPQDDYKGIKKSPYLPTDPNGGHSLYNMYFDFAEESRKDFGYGDWIKVIP